MFGEKLNHGTYMFLEGVGRVADVHDLGEAQHAHGKSGGKGEIGTRMEAERIGERRAHAAQHTLTPLALSTRDGHYRGRTP